MSPQNPSSDPQLCQCPAAPLGKGTPRHQLHKAAQLVLMHEGGGSAQIPRKCNFVSGVALDKDHPSVCSPA